MDKEQIDHMTNRFLSWALPDDFAPDNGVSYSQRAYAPTGTNLFTFTQARAMVLHMLTGLPEGDPEFEGELSDDDRARIDAAWETHKSAAPMTRAPDSEGAVGEVRRYPASWDEPWTPPASLQEPLRSALVAAHERTLAMTPEEKRAMFDAQRESFIRAMAPCEHGDPDWETCPQCLAQFAHPATDEPEKGLG